MKKEIQYKLIYAPVLSCNSIWFLLMLLLVHKWKTVQMDYVLAFIQDPVQKDLKMKTTKWFELHTKEDTTDNVLKLHKNVYGQKNLADCGTRIWQES